MIRSDVSSATADTAFAREGRFRHPTPFFQSVFDSGSSMKILGIQLSKPSFNEVTASAVMAAGLWLACMALLRVSEQPLDRIEAGGALLVIFWGCVGVRMGIRIDRGVRHLAANLLCGGVILALYHAIVSLIA